MIEAGSGRKVVNGPRRTSSASIQHDGKLFHAAEYSDLPFWWSVVMQRLICCAIMSHAMSSHVIPYPGVRPPCHDAPRLRTPESMILVCRSSLIGAAAAFAANCKGTLVGSLDQCHDL